MKIAGFDLKYNASSDVLMVDDEYEIVGTNFVIQHSLFDGQYYVYEIINEETIVDFGDEYSSLEAAVQAVADLFGKE